MGKRVSQAILNERANIARIAERAAQGGPSGNGPSYISNYKRPSFLPQDIPGLIAHFIGEGVNENPATHDVLSWRNHATGQLYFPSGAGLATFQPTGWDGKPVVLSTFLSTYGLALPATPAAALPLGGFSAFLVANLRTLPPNNGNQFRPVAAVVADVRVIAQIQNTTGTIQMRLFNQTALSSFAVLGPTVTVGRKLLSYVWAGANSRMRVNGGSDTTGDAGPEVGAREIAILNDAASAASSIDGQVAEIIVYNRTVSLVEQLLIEAYLNSKWTIF